MAAAKRCLRWVAVCAVLAVIAAGCQRDRATQSAVGAQAGAATTDPPQEASMKLRSASFAHEHEIPSKHTCEGEDTAPALEWDGAPHGTKSFALIVDDPDAPDPRAPKMTWVHWVLYGIPSQVHALPEGARSLPAGTREGLNDWKRTGYRGPCPPVGRHRYFLKLCALDSALGDLGTPTKAQLEKAMEGHVLAKAELVGTYQKQKK